MTVTLPVMPDDEATQETQPAEGEPVTIPVPEKDEVMAALRKVAKADTPSGDEEL